MALKTTRPAEDYALALVELLPWVTPSKPFITRIAHAVRWRRALWMSPLVVALVTTSQPAQAIGGVGDVVHDPMMYAGMMKRWYDENINRLIEQHTELAHWLSQMYTGYKSAKMANSIAQRVRYGNIDFLVEFALPKLDFVSDSRMWTSPGGSFVDSKSTRTTINFVPSPNQSTDDLQWLMRYGNRALRDKVSAVAKNSQSMKDQILQQIKSALTNPEGDVVTTTLMGVGNSKYGITIESRPEVWEQLAAVDATMAWVTSQHRFGIDTVYHDPATVMQRLSAQKERAKNLQLQDAYESLIAYQQAAAATGENLYDNPGYAQALQRYYTLAAADNAQRKASSGVSAPTSIQHIQNIEERVQALQEIAGGAAVALSAAQNRQEATRKNLNNIGKAYPGSTFKDPSFSDWISLDKDLQKGDSQSIILGSLLKQISLLQAMSQDLSEMNKRMTAESLKGSKEAIEQEAARKAAILANSVAPACEVAKQAKEEAIAARETAAREAATTVARATTTTVLPASLAIFSAGARAETVTVPLVPTPEQKQEALDKASQSFARLQKVEVTKTVEQFRKDLGKSMTNFKGSQGFLSNLLFATSCAFRQAIGQPFDMAEEARAWQDSGEKMNTVYTGQFDYQLVGVTPKPAPFVPTPVPPSPIPASLPATTPQPNPAPSAVATGSPSN